MTFPLPPFATRQYQVHDVSFDDRWALYAGSALAGNGERFAVELLFFAPERELGVHYDEWRWEFCLLGDTLHPNVWGLLDHWQTAQHFVFVRFPTPGPTWRQLQRHARKHKQQIPLDISTRMLVDVARGLHAVHSRTDDNGTPLGLTLRRFTEESVRMTAGGALLEVSSPAVFPAPRESAQGAMVLARRLRYMAPDIARGAWLLPQANVWTLGVLLWEALAGEQFLQGKQELLLLETLVGKEELSKLPDGVVVQNALRELLQHTLTRDVSNRIPSALAFAEALEGLGNPASNQRVNDWFLALPSAKFSEG